MIKETSWLFVLLHPSRWVEAVLYFLSYFERPNGGSMDRPDPRDIDLGSDFLGGSYIIPVRFSLREKAEAQNWGPTKQSRNSCTAYSKGHGVEIVNTIEHSKVILVNKEVLWENQELTGAHRDRGDTIQNAEAQFHKNPQGFPQTEYRRMRRQENTVWGAKIWLVQGDTIRTGLYWKWSPVNRDTNSGYMRKTGFFIPGEGAILGGHAADIVGYDNEKLCPDGTYGAFEILESELEDWGEGNKPGQFWVKYADFHNLFSKYVSRDTWDLPR